MILLDTHALLWFAIDHAKLGSRTDRTADAALRKDEVLVSAFSFWELAVLHKKARVRLNGTVEAFRNDSLAQGIVEVPVDGTIAIVAASLDDFHGDPVDRIIVASALVRNAVLVTADELILGWRGALKRQDARL